MEGVTDQWKEKRFGLLRPIFVREDGAIILPVNNDESLFVRH